MKASELFELPPSLPFAEYFDLDAAPWEWVSKIKEALESEGVPKGTSGFDSLPSGVVIEGDVYIHPTVDISPNVVIQGPAYIGANTKIRPGAFIRGNVIVGENCVLGNSCEFKNCLLLDNVQAAHFNYVGDTVLGNKTHLAAGVICSNLRLDQASVKINLPEGRTETGMRKLGALIGDGAEVGCNSVLNPGTVLGKRSLVFPSMAFGGYLDHENVAAVAPKIVKLLRRD